MDEALRDLERVWRASKDDLDAERYLRVRMANYDFPLRRMTEDAIKAARFIEFGPGGEQRAVTASNVVEYLLGLPINHGRPSDTEIALTEHMIERQALASRARPNDAHLAENELSDLSLYTSMLDRAIDSTRAETRAHIRPRRRGPGEGTGRGGGNP